MRTDVNVIRLNNVQAAVFMNGDEACLATGDADSNVKLWME